MSNNKGYFNFLYTRVLLNRDLQSPRSYAVVCDILHTMEFKAFVGHDDNRSADALELRNEFISEADRMGIHKALLLPPEPSVLEMLVALSMRAEHMGSKLDRQTWFLKFLENLDLFRFNDRIYKPQDRANIIRRVLLMVNRRYLENGSGGLFPLERPHEDQREVELWYQMAAYINENRL